MASRKAVIMNYGFNLEVTNSEGIKIRLLDKEEVLQTKRQFKKNVKYK
jgi:hypothetical protein